MRCQGPYLTMYVGKILKATCNNNSKMLSNDFNSYLEFGEGLITLISDIIKHCSQGLFALDASCFGGMILSRNFAARHAKPEICALGLEVLRNFILVSGKDAFTRNRIF